MQCERGGRRRCCGHVLFPSRFPQSSRLRKSVFASTQNPLTLLISPRTPPRNQLRPFYLILFSQFPPDYPTPVADNGPHAGSMQGPIHPNPLCSAEQRYQWPTATDRHCNSLQRQHASSEAVSSRGLAKGGLERSSRAFSASALLIPSEVLEK
jgi:hypothetical protein